MNIEALREYCISKPGVTESFPFDEHTLVFKVMNKMYALTGLNRELSINLKCDPARALLLREAHECVEPGWHMSKKHWNTVRIDGSEPDAFIHELIDHSYEQVVAGLPKKDRVALEELRKLDGSL